MDSQFNLRSPAVKRLMKEAQELREATENYFAQPLDDNLFEWHFTVRGPADSDFKDGYYHGRIILPNDYPMKPPSIIILTPNGRFEINKKICLSISGHHPESWQPSWSIRTALLAIIGFMPTESLGAIGSLNYTSDERQALAIKSQLWKCPTCGLVKNLLKEKTDDHLITETDRQNEELAKQICFKDSESTTKQQVQTETSTENEVTPNEELRQRVNVSSHSSQATSAQQQQHQQASTNESTQAQVENSGTRKSTYLIIIITVTIAFLLFRRMFLVQ